MTPKDLPELPEPHEVLEIFGQNLDVYRADQMRDYAAAAYELGARSTAAQPAGWKLVPIEPTPEMLDKGAMQIAMNHQRVQTAEKSAAAVFSAMLAAAPPAASGDSTPPSAPVQGDPSGAPRAEPEAAGQDPRDAAIERMRETLTRIARWVGQFPATGRFWDDAKTDPMSYGAAFGSNGERDYMRSQAVDALLIVDELFPEPPQAASDSRGD